MIDGALIKLKIGNVPLGLIKAGHVMCSEDLPDWNLKKDKGYKVHWGEEGPFIYSDKWLTVDRIDLWALDDKLTLFNWIRE